MHPVFILSIFSSATALVSLSSDDPVAVERHLVLAEQIDNLIEVLQMDCPWNRAEIAEPILSSGINGNDSDIQSRRKRSTANNGSVEDYWGPHLRTGKHLTDQLKRDWIRCQNAAMKDEMDWLVDIIGVPELNRLYQREGTPDHNYLATQDWSPSNITANSTLNHTSLDTVGECVQWCERITDCKSVVYSRSKGICSLLNQVDDNMNGQLLARGQTERLPTSSRGPGLIYAQPINSLPIETGVSVHSVPEYSGCTEAQDSGASQSGLYQLNPTGDSQFIGWCDFDESGGWLVMQRRINGSVDFYRNWTEYKNGFGNPSGELWLGNDRLHNITRIQRRLSIYLEDFNGAHAYANYSSFQIANETNMYKLSVSGYSGDDKDSLTYHNGMYFSTRDQDNDAWSVQT